MIMRKHVFYGILALVSLLGLGITQSVRANVIATINQVGTSVVGTGSGTVDLAGLTFLGSGSLAAGVNPSIAAFNAGSGAYDDYSGVSGPTSFGIGGPSFPASSSTGNPVSIFGQAGELRLPQGYLTGGPLSGTFTFNNATFAGLGVTPGTYVWTWGTGVHADSFTLQIGPAGVPDAGSTLPLLSFALLGVAALRRKLSC